MDTGFEYDKFLFNNDNIKYRAYANKVIKTFSPHYAPEIISLGFKKRILYDEYFLQRLNLYMLRYSIKYKVFLHIKFKMYKKEEVFEWAQALDRDGKLIEDSIFQTLLIAHEKICNFVKIREIIMKHINALFCHYRKTHKKIYLDAREHTILLQRGDYYFENDRIE
ncbi:hypothetical protein COBT_003010, partial [Conglomerata obtusa]